MLTTLVEGEEGVLHKKEFLCQLSDTRFASKTHTLVLEKIQACVDFLGIGLSDIASITCDGGIFHSTFDFSCKLWLSGSNLVAACKKIPAVDHCWCACHQLHLCCKKMESFDTVGCLLEKVNKVTTHFRKSDINWGKLLECSEETNEYVTVAIPKEVDVRWLSTLRMLEGFCKYESAMTLYQTKVADMNVAESDWALIHDVVEVMGKMSVATLYLERSGFHPQKLNLFPPCFACLADSSVGNIIPVVDFTIQQLMVLGPMRCEAGVHFKEEMVREMKQRFITSVPAAVKR